MGAYAASSEAIIKFSYLSGLGGAIGIDNVSFSNSSASIETLLPQPVLNIYPNPASDVINIDGTGSGIISVTITDLSGRIVFSQNGGGLTSDTVSIGTSAFTNGMYIIEVVTVQGVQSGKVLISQ
ncbi:MAG: T9SS type A sorting domain-containing protein [Bacteroidota bacterium]|nr:T9SS type A sorting domain-containing protein [Bacteroidota bacterium]